MTYNPKTNTLRVRPEDMRRAHDSLMWSLKHIRLAAGKPLDSYKKEGPLEDVDFAMKGILEAAEALGIEIEARWGNELDLRKVGS